MRAVVMSVFAAAILLAAAEVEAGGLAWTQKQIYMPNEQILVQFAGLPGYSGDWITIVRADARFDTYGEWFYANGQRSGTHVFKGMPPGSYEVRVYFNWPAGGYNVQSRHPFTVGGGGGGGAVTIPYMDFGQTEEVTW